MYLNTYYGNRVLWNINLDISDWLTLSTSMLNWYRTVLSVYQSVGKVNTLATLANAPETKVNVSITSASCLEISAYPLLFLLLILF